MRVAVGDFLPSAVDVAISPVPIIAVILMLFGPDARSTGPAFAASKAITQTAKRCGWTTVSTRRLFEHVHAIA
jgi:hypothetical protein